MSSNVATVHRFIRESPQDHVTSENGFTLVSQGAEARVFSGQFLGRSVIVKERFSKSYRHPVLDEKITARRVASEAKTLVRCKAQLGSQQTLFDVPAVYFVDPFRHHRIYMERVNGITVKRYLLGQFLRFQGTQQQQQRQCTPGQLENQNAMHEGDGGDAMDSASVVEFDEDLFKTDATQVDCYDDAAFALMHRIGQSIAILHDSQLVHGDLTTSNLLLRDGDPSQLVVIDFGLSYTSPLEEDKAVDLYVLERALISTHPFSQRLFAQLLDGYAIKSKSAKAVIDRLGQVRLRGRKRAMVG